MTAYTPLQQAKYNALTREMRCEIADCIRQDNLEYVNQLQKPIIPKDTIYTRYIKRAFDIVLSGIALIITSPLNLVLLVCTVFDVGRPIIFKQVRMGRKGVPFHIIKFRNMTNERDSQGELLPAAERVTRFGKFVRATSLDELLNFWSIFKGDMSLVGPRPLKVQTAERLSIRHAARTEVRPGLECPVLQHLDHVETWDDRFENDVWYVENVSLATDARMLLDVVRMTFDMKERRMRAAANGGGFVGYDREGHALDLKSIPEKYLDEVLSRHGMLDDLGEVVVGA